MLLTLRILLTIVTLICFWGGANIMIKGAKSFLPMDTPPQYILDNLVRFLSGIYFGLGFLLAYSVFNIEKIDDLVYYIGIIVIFSGLGRMYSRHKVGSAGKYFDYIMVVEILLGLSIIILALLRHK